MPTKMLNIVPWTVQQQMRTPHKELVFIALLQFLPAEAAMASKQANNSIRLAPVSNFGCAKCKKLWWIDKVTTLDSHKGLFFPLFEFNCWCCYYNAIAALDTHTHTAHSLCWSGCASQENGHMNGVTLLNLSSGGQKMQRRSTTNRNKSRSRRRPL